MNEISGLVQAQKIGVADSEGRYEVRGLGPGSKFFIEVGAEGFAAQWIKELPSPDASGISTKDFYIGRGAEVSVLAVDAETGAPIPNARILGWAYTLAHSVEGPSGTVTNPKRLRVLADVRSGPDGRARITHVPSWGVHPNTHNQFYTAQAALGGVAALADGYAIASRHVDVPEDGATVAVTLPCRRAASLAGRVVDESGAPVAGVQLWFQATTPLEDSWLPGPLRPDLASLKSDANGAYRFVGVPSSTTGAIEVVVKAWPVGSDEALYSHTEITVHVSGTGTLRAPDLVLKKGRGRAFGFRILDPAGAPVWGARIDEDASTDPLALTDRDGRATCGVAPRLEDEEGRPQAPFVFVRSPGFAVEKVTLDPAVRDEIVVRLRSGQRIAGRVVHEDGAPATNAFVLVALAEHPIDETFPSVAPSEEMAVFPTERGIGAASVDASGAFEIRDLQPGKYHLQAKILSNRHGAITATVADVPAGTRGLEIKVSQPSQPLRGTLTINVRERGTKRPVMRCTVGLRSGRREIRASATAPGQFSASSLAPGLWILTLRTPNYAGTDPIEVTIRDDPKPVVLDVELERGITMRGHLKGKGVASFNDPRAWIYGGPGAPAVAVAADGAYTITGLRAGASYVLNLTHQKSPDLWETFTAPARVLIPNQAADVIERDIELVVSGGLGIRILAPRMFDPVTQRPESDEQGRLAEESRVTVRAVDGAWSADQKLLTVNIGWRVPFGTYVVRLEVAGQDPQERTVKVDSDSTWVDFTVP